MSNASLTLTQRRFSSRDFELRAGKAVVATLCWPGASSSLAIGKAINGEWSFNRVGVFKWRVIVREKGSLEDAAILKRSGWVGDSTVQFASGRTFDWRTTDGWGTGWAFKDVDGRTLVGFKPGSEKLTDLFKFQVGLAIDYNAGKQPELSILELLGCYMMVMSFECQLRIAHMYMMHP